MFHRPIDSARRRFVLLASVAAVAVLAAACNGDAGEPAQPEQPEATMELEAMLDREGDAADEDAADEPATPDEGEPIEPGTMLGPDEVTAPVGDVAVSFTPGTEVEGGTVAPGDLPASLELLVEGGAIVIFEAIGHVAAVEGDEPTVAEGLPEDLEAWLADDLPGDVEVAEGPTAIDDGIQVRLDNPDEESSSPVVLWYLDADAEAEQQEGHGPPPGQAQDLWLRELDDRWIGVVTYGPEVERDLAATIAESLDVS